MMATHAHRDLEAVAWDFLSSEFAGSKYVNWSLDRRVDTYLRRCGKQELLNAGTAFDDLIDHVMANFARALQSGVLDDSPRV